VQDTAQPEAEQQPAHQPDQLIDPLGGLPCTQEDGKGAGQDHMDEEGVTIWENDPDDDDMSTALQDKQTKLEARQRKAQQTKQQIEQKASKALSGRTDRPHKKSHVKSTG
jgi:hypothetical protein